MHFNLFGFTPSLTCADSDMARRLAGGIATCDGARTGSLRALVANAVVGHSKSSRMTQIRAI